MNQSIIITGFPCSGKTSLINNLSHGKVQIPFHYNSKFNSINANSLRLNRDMEDYKFNHYIHYDNLRPYKRNQENYRSENDIFLNFFSQLKIKKTITVLAPRKTMVKRMQHRYIRIENNINHTRKRKLSSVIELYQDKKKYLEELNKWFKYLSLFQATTSYIYLNEQDRFIGLDIKKLNYVLSEQID